ncbi:MAG: DMT family transporter [Gemmiger sp.]
MKGFDRKQLANTLLLMLGALIWGVAFVAQSVGSGYVGPYTFLAARSWLACAFLLGILLVRGRMGRAALAQSDRRALLLGGSLCGVMLFAASAAQQMGVATTTTAKASFLTALYVVLVPLLGIFAGKRPGLRLWVCVAASVAGLYLLCMAGHDTLRLSGGEWQLLLCSLLFSFQILLVDRYSPHVDGVALSLMQFFTTAVLSTVFMLLFEQPTWEQLRGAAVSIAYCGILSSGVGYTLQIVGQRNLDPTIASMAMCLESVFGALAGWVVLGQSLTPTELAGCCLMFAAIIGAQLPDRRRAQNQQQTAAESVQL